MRIIRKFQATAFAAAVAVALAFGATQAMAGPAAAVQASTCEFVECTDYCWSYGYEYGYCENGVTCWCCTWWGCVPRAHT